MAGRFGKVVRVEGLERTQKLVQDNISRVVDQIGASEIIDGVLLQDIELLVSVLFTGDVTIGTNTITNAVGDLGLLQVGMTLTQVPNIPAGTVVAGVSGTTVSMSANATATLIGGAILASQVNILVPHGLTREPLGWVVSGRDAESTVWSVARDASFLTLDASANVTIDLWVF